jgi:hypothetical protein
VISENKLATLALERLGASESQIPLPRLISLVPMAVRKVVSDAFEKGGRARLESLRRTYTVTATAGEADISPLLTAAQGLYPDALGQSEVRDASTGRRFEWQADRDGVRIMARVGFPCVAGEDSTLILSDMDGTLGTFAGDINILAAGVSYSAGNVDIDEVLEPAVVDALVELVQGEKAEEAA